MIKHLNTQHIPVLTIMLFFTIWTIEIIACFGGVDRREALIATYGLDFSNCVTYVTYAFIHANMGHLIGNSFTLLLYGWLVELQLNSRWFIFCIATSALAGAVGPAFLHAFTGVEAIGVGISTVTSALSVLWIATLARYWKPKNVSLFDDRVLWLVVFAWLTIWLLIDVSGDGLDYSVVGHFSGSLVGAILAMATLRPRAPRTESAWLMGRIRIMFNVIKIAQKSLTEGWANRNRAGEVLEALFGWSALAGLIVALQSIG